MNHTLSLIVPCYNEAKTIETCIENILNLSREVSFSLEVIIVDDSSTDGSWQILEKIAGQYNEIQIYKH